MAQKLATYVEQIAEILSTHERTVEAQRAFAVEAGQLRIERNHLKEMLTNTTGQWERIGKQFDALSQQLSHGQKAVSASVRPLSSATNRTKNKTA